MRAETGFYYGPPTDQMSIDLGVRVCVCVWVYYWYTYMMYMYSIYEWCLWMVDRESGPGRSYSPFRTLMVSPPPTIQSTFIKFPFKGLTRRACLCVLGCQSARRGSTNWSVVPQANKDIELRSSRIRLYALLPRLILYIVYISLCFLPLKRIAGIYTVNCINDCPLAAEIQPVNDLTNK